MELERYYFFLYLAFAPTSLLAAFLFYMACNEKLIELIIHILLLLGGLLTVTLVYATFFRLGDTKFGEFSWVIPFLGAILAFSPSYLANHCLAVKLKLPRKRTYQISIASIFIISIVLVIGWLTHDLISNANILAKMLVFFFPSIIVFLFVYLGLKRAEM